MTREKIMKAASEYLRTHAPYMTASVADELLSDGALQRWADSVERRRPNGLIARVRRRLGLSKDRRLTDEQRRIIEAHVRELVARRMRG